MLALLALPLLAMSAQGQVIVMPSSSFLYKISSGGGQEPAGGPHRGPGAAPVPGLPAVQVRTKKVWAQIWILLCLVATAVSHRRTSLERLIFFLFIGCLLSFKHWNNKTSGISNRFLAAFLQDVCLSNNSWMAAP